jgi:hypothetical protein
MGKSLRDPKTIADVLLDRYGIHAEYEAALRAQQAIDRHDLSGCLIWREVLKILKQAKTVTY